MADETLTITLEPELAARLREKIDSGIDAAEILRAGLERFEAPLIPEGWTIEEVRAAIEEADREGGEYTLEEVESFLDEKRKELEAKFSR